MLIYFKFSYNRGAYEGSGIGLAIVKLSVEKLGGSLKLESEEGKGS
ncbi:MAG: ATP-binding protein [Saprospiraceae bacterium]